MRKKIEEGAGDKLFPDRKNGNEKDAVLFVIDWDDSQNHFFLDDGLHKVIPDDHSCILADGIHYEIETMAPMNKNDEYINDLAKGNNFYGKTGNYLKIYLKHTSKP